MHSRVISVSDQHAITVLVSCTLEDRSFKHTTSTSYWQASLCLGWYEYKSSKSYICMAHTCKNGGYCYFKRHCPIVISNSNPVSEYWHRYPALKLSSMSRSSTYTLAHIIMNNFNSVYCPCLIATGSTTDWQVQYVCRRCQK